MFDVIGKGDLSFFSLRLAMLDLQLGPKSMWALLGLLTYVHLVRVDYKVIGADHKLL